MRQKVDNGESCNIEFLILGEQHMNYMGQAVVKCERSKVSSVDEGIDIFLFWMYAMYQVVFGDDIIDETS